MSETESKTYVFSPENGGIGNLSGILGMLSPLLQRNGIDPNVLMSLKNNNGFGGDGGWFIWVIFLLFLGRNGFGSFGNQVNNDYGRDLLMQAINGNRSAVSELATNLNCSIGQVQSAINNVSTQVQNVGNQVGMSSQQVINAVQSGNCQIANQLQQCCCNINNSITTQGYENRIAISEQTNQLGSKFDAGTNAISAQIQAQTTFLNEKFCQLEQRELQNKLDASREEVTSLKNQLSNQQQTNIFAQMIAQATNPLSTALNSLQNDINGIKCKLPETVTVPNNNGVYIPACVASQFGLYGNLLNNNGSIWN